MWNHSILKGIQVWGGFRWSWSFQVDWLWAKLNIFECKAVIELPFWTNPDDICPVPLPFPLSIQFYSVQCCDCTIAWATPNYLLPCCNEHNLVFFSLLCFPILSFNIMPSICSVMQMHNGIFLEFLFPFQLERCSAAIRWVLTAVLMHSLYQVAMLIDGQPGLCMELFPSQVN